MASEIPTPTPSLPPNRRRIALYIAGPVVIGVIVLLLWLVFKKDNGQPQPPPVADAKPIPLFVPRELAAHEALDRNGVLAYCRNLKHAEYQGILRGGHGALWAGEANPWDRVLLASEALAGIGVEARIVPGERPRLVYRDGDNWQTVRLDVPDQPQTSPELPAGALTMDELAAQAAACFHAIRPVLILEKDGRIQRAEADAQFVADWVYRPVLLTAQAIDTDLEFVLSVGAKQIVRSGSLTGVKRASLELSWQNADRLLTWTRELFDADNAGAKNPGHDAVRKGDCYAIVIAAGPLNMRVHNTRLRMLETAGPQSVADETARFLVAQAIKYQVDCDDRTQALATETKVEVFWNEPRITIVANEQPSKGDPGLSLDALNDAVEVVGRRSREFHVARGLANDIIETRVVFEARRKPVISASTVFSNYKATSPDSAVRRIAVIESEAKRLLAYEPIGSTVQLDALPPLAPSDDPNYRAPNCPPLFIERTSDGVALRGLRAGEENKDTPWTKYSWQTAELAPFADRSSELAHVADAMMCRQIQRADHVLKCTAASAWPLDSLPVMSGSFLEYSVRDDKKEQRFGIRVSLKNGAPTDGKAPLAADWPKIALPGKAGAVLAPRELLSGGEAIKVKVRIGEIEREVAARRIALPEGASATLLDCPTFPLVLVWEQGKTSLVLASASPVVQGRIRDRETGMPAPSTVSQARSAKMAISRKPLNLRAFKPQGPEGGGKWRLAADGLSVMQSSYYNPSFFVGPDDVFESTIHGTFEVTESGSGHTIGFVLGYRSPIAEKSDAPGDFDYLLFTWTSDRRPEADQGFTLARVKGTFSGTSTEFPPFNDLKKRTGFDVLATHRGKGLGWSTKIEYPFEIRYGKERVVISVDGREVINVQGAFAPGRFGFFNYWQIGARYRLLSAGETSIAASQDSEAQSSVPVAADGAYALSASAVAPRLILILDRSGSMEWGLNPKANEGNPMLPPDKKCRMDHLKKEVLALLDKLPPGVEIALWSFSSGFLDRNPANPSHCREECPFTTDLDRARKALESLKPDGGTPITGAVVKLLEHVKADPRSRDAVAVFLTDGVNNCKDPTAPNAYRQRKGKNVVHTIGFAIEAGGPAEKEMQELARVSGGNYHLAGTGDALKLAFDEFRTSLLNVDLAVTSPCHSREERAIKSADLGRTNEDFALTYGCSTCKCKDRTIISITKQTVARLKECEGLTPKGKRLIEERVKDGTWVVSIPTSRVNIGPVSAYGWFETEQATGRVVGRTEDGLHGSVAGGSFPENVYRAGHDFITWYQGIVSYTIGSVDAGLKWHREPGFLNSTPEDFKRFVQANALSYSAKWWSEFGDAAFPESISAYWSGVCLNFTLQSMAMQMPSIDCFRYWGRALCKQLGDKIKSMPADWINDQIGKKIDAEFGPQLREYVENTKTWYERINASNASDKQKEEAKDFFDRVKNWAQDVLNGKVDGVLKCDERLGFAANAPK